MASVSFEKSRGRSGRVPLSFYAPIIVEGDKPLWKVLPANAVPTGKGNKNQQIGYWNEQPRWRMVKGRRVELPSKWHFYYLGTGPHADQTFRTRTDGVFWVAVQGSKTEPTGLGTRKRNQETVTPNFGVKLPANIQIQQNSSSPNSRASSRSNSRGASVGRNQQNNNSRSNSRNNSRNPSNNRGGTLLNSQNNSRDPSRNRGQQNQKKNNNSGNTSQDDLVAAVKQALLGLGFSDQTQNKSKSNQNKSGSQTPKEQRSKSPARQSQPAKRQTERPEWKRVPNKSNSVTACFGPRDAARNFGNASLISEGVDSKHYPQLAELVPTPAALLFGSRITTRELSDEVELHFHYKMNVPKSDKSLPPFLAQVNAYEGASDVSAETIVNAMSETPEFTFNPAAPEFAPMSGVDDDVHIEIIDQVFDSTDA
ncbi:nucleocapsid [alphacoronavirus sp. WA3607]|uniref:Nucleoprotein n=1 Tax=alphacoronavirus sp. WA3607 TaxID=3070155 RepID=A0AA48Z9D5_9ALPC|nr:nucleocapsid [Alphacoronavirus sp.]QGX41955.1 nucleocapsid [alphacoronavirus sp. WA3607]